MFSAKSISDFLKSQKINIAHNQLLYKGYDVKTGWLDKEEIDFVASKNNEITYLQVTFQLNEEKTIEREFGNLLKIKDNYTKMVITTDETFPNTMQGIPVIPLREFLINH